MLIPLIVVPCSIVGFGIVMLLDRAGAFSQVGGDVDGAGGVRVRDPRSGRRLYLLALVVMGGWVLAWIVLLGIGLGVVWV
jgi:hypothetical protein